MSWQTLLAFLVGLVLFIYGIENFSREVLSIAGERFRRILRRATRNRATGGLTGMLLTALVQSSTATTVITISLVSAGMISFTQSLGVILGANVGTTITAQLVAFKVTAYAPIFIIAGFLVSLLRRPYGYIGKGIFYFGLVFFGLNLVSEAIVPIRDHPQLINLFSNLSQPLIALLVGLFFTALVQSSSVTTGLVVILAGSGILTLTQGILVLLGSNIGTTITAIIAASRLSLHAKRGAAAHTIFNIAGVLLILPFIAPFTDLIEWIGGTGAQQVANAHTIFNVGLALIFMFLLRPLEKTVRWIIRGDEKEVLIGTKYLQSPLPKSNKRAFRLIEKEVGYSLEVVHDFYATALEAVTHPASTKRNAIDKYETLADLLDEKIEAALLTLSGRDLKDKEAEKVTYLVRISNLAEQLSDAAKDLGRLPDSGAIAGASLSEEALKSIEKLYSRMTDPLISLKKAFPKSIPEYSKHIRHLDAMEAAITRSYKRHLIRMRERKATGGSIFVESSSLLNDGSQRLRELIRLCQKYARLGTD